MNHNEIGKTNMSITIEQALRNSPMVDKLCAEKDKRIAELEAQLASDKEARELGVANEERLERECAKLEKMVDVLCEQLAFGFQSNKQAGHACYWRDFAEYRVSAL